MREQALARPEGLLVQPDSPCGTAVLVLSGSSGAVEAERCRVLAKAGAVAMSIRWFGGADQQPGPARVPLEVLVEALNRLSALGARLALMGTSFGAEAALLVAARDPRVAAVVAVAPTPVSWAGVIAGGMGGLRLTAHWTWRGDEVPYVPFVEGFVPESDPPAYRPLYERSLAAFPDRAARAAITVEDIAGPVVLVAGEDDQVWPGAEFARMLAARRHRHGLPTSLVTHPSAGHRVIFPGEVAQRRGMAIARGGTPEADAALGALAWPHVVAALQLRESPR